jgi:hypothetical protein
MLIIACTETILVLLNKFMLEENYKKKVLYVCGMSWSLLTFLFTFYASYIITFGYFLIAGAVWIILKNRKEYKVKMADILLIVGGLLVVAIFVIGFFYTSQDVVNFLVNSVFPGEGDKERVNGIPLIFSYVFSYLIPFKSQIHGLYYGGIFSLIPITFALAFYYAFFLHEQIVFYF